MKRSATLLLAVLLGIGAGAFSAGAAQAAPSDGTRDTAFAPIGVSLVEVYASALDAQGRLVVGGSFVSAEGVTRGNIARYLPDGTLDTSFATGSGFSNIVSSLAIDSSGNVLAGGDFATYDGTTANRIARLTPTGALDTTFVTGTGFDNTVSSLAIDSSGDVLAGGTFTTYDGTTANRIARLTPAGALDTTFVTGTGFDNTVRTLVVDSSGNVLAGGDFTAYQGSTANRIARLSSTGALDTTLATGTGFDNTVKTLTTDSGGTILVGGNFATFNGTTGINRIARLTPTGALDPTLATGTGFNYAVNDLAIDSAGNILAVGDFDAYDGTTASLVARLSSPVSLGYDANGGTGTAPATQSTLSGRSVTVAAGTGLTRTGFTFAGWNTTATGTGTAVAAGASRTLTARTSTLFAQWTAVPASPTPTPVTTGVPTTVTTTVVTADTGGPSTLAATGVDDAVPLTALGGVLLLAGTAAVLAGRRRAG